MIRRDRFFTNPGSCIKPVYNPAIDKDGKMVLKVSGYENTDDMIQSQVPMTDINVILARVKNGDVEALNQASGVYGDFTQMPKTFAELLQLQIDAKNIYDKLTVEQKKEFDFDFNKFFADAGSEEWMKKIYGSSGSGAVDIKVDEQKESEVIEP